MHSAIYPEKLNPGDSIGVIAPADSLAKASEAHYQKAQTALDLMGVSVVFGPNTNRTDKDRFNSTSVAARVEDIEWAYSSKEIKGVLCAAGGYNSIQLLESIDWDTIKNNPKIFCGYSDITVLHEAIGSIANQVTYYGPNFTSLGVEQTIEYTSEWMRSMLFTAGWKAIKRSSKWSDDDKKLTRTQKYAVLNEGQVEGQVRGGNLGTLFLLQGTDYFNHYADNTVLFLEDDDLPGKWSSEEFDRKLRSLFLQPYSEKIGGLVIGRFQPNSQVSYSKLRTLIGAIEQCRSIPVVAGVDFGHTDPKAIIPMSGECQITADGSESLIQVKL